MKNDTIKNKNGRQPKQKDGELLYSKTKVKNAIKFAAKYGGFYTVVGRHLGCSSTTAKKYVEMWDETKELMALAQSELNNLACVRFMEAVDDGEQWAIDRVLKRIPEEGLSPIDKKEEKGGQNDIDLMKTFAESIAGVYVKKPE